MAGFRGVVPSAETIDQIVGNLLRARQALGEQALVTQDPFASEFPEKGAASLHDKVGLNDALLEVFLGLKDGTTEVIPLARDAA
jgi:hypothetical protein